jgi:hypothetical protein
MWRLAFAGKPAPIGIASYTAFVFNEKTSGSWLASDEVLPVSTNPKP